jgi:hypothetical protein
LRSLESEPDRRYQHAVDIKTDVQGLAGDGAGIHRSGRSPLPDALSEQEAQRREARDHAAPDWIGLAALALFVVGWMFTEAMLNLRYPGVALAIAVMVGFAYWVLRLHLKFMPELSAELSRQSRFQRGIALAFGFTIFFAGLSAAIGAQVNYWSYWDDFFSHSGFPELSAGTAGGDFRVEHLLDQLRNVPGGTGTFQIRSNTLTVGLPESWVRAIWAILSTVGAPLACLLSAYSVLDTRVYRNTWKLHWRPALLITAELFSAIALAYFIGTVVASR